MVVRVVFALVTLVTLLVVLGSAPLATATEEAATESKTATEATTTEAGTTTTSVSMPTTTTTVQQTAADAEKTSPPVIRYLAKSELFLTVTTEPQTLPPSEGSIVLRLTDVNGVARANETLHLVLRGRTHVLVNTAMVTGDDGTARVGTYFSSAGTYTLTVTHRTETVEVPIIVRGTMVLVTGAVLALGVVLALLFEKKLGRA
jgi:hypothetical protein